MTLKLPGSQTKMSWRGHRMTFYRAMPEPAYAKCDACALKIGAEEALEGTVTVEPCKETEEGRRLIAEAEAAKPVPITEPCLAVPSDWTGSDAEAIGLAVAGAVGGIALERDQARAEVRQVRDILKMLADQYPQTSWAGANVALDAARDYLAATEPDPDAKP